MNGYHALDTYTLRPPAWREPLTIATSAYPELFPGATALYPPAAGSSTGTSTYAGQSRDAANVDTGIVGVTKAKEDDLSESAVKTGLVTRPYVQSETFSAHQLIYPKFTHGHALPILSKLVSLVLEKRQSSPDITPQPGPWVYKAPSRVVYNDARREAWFNDLANPAVPLHKLSRNIPNNPASVTAAGTGTYGSARGSASSTSGTPIDKHMEMLLTRQIQIDRAVWFLRAIAGAEVAQALKSSRAASSLPPAATYLVDFSNSVFEFVRRQLNEIVLPLTHHAGLGLSSRPGMSVKGRARNTLSEEQGRARFLARWKYLCALTDRLAREGLIERTTWASKTIDWVATCHIAQLGWVIDLVADTCLDDILRVGWMCKSLVGALVSRLVDLNAYPSQETPDALIVETTVATQSLLRRIWLRNNNAFIVPQIHAQPESLKLLKDVALIDGADSVHWQDVIHRIESLHCENGQSDQETDDTRYVDIEDGSPDRPKPAGSVLERHRCLEQAPGAQYFLSILDVWTTQEPLSELCSRYLAPLPSPLLDRRTSHTSAPTPSSNTKYVPATPIGLRLDLLLNWAVSSCRFGDHRRYLALHVCKVYLDPPQYIELSSGRAEQPQPHRRHRQAMMQRSIVNLLDSLDGSSQRDLDAAVHLCCELVSHAVLDVASLLQMIVTRGVSPVVSRSPTHSIYLRILKESSAHIASQSLRYQLSKIASSTDSHDVECLDNALSQERYSVSRQLSLLVDASEGPGDRITRAADTESGDIYKEGLTSARKRELYSTWLVPTVVGNINESLDTDGRYEEQLALLIQILQSVGAYDCILQVSYAVLAHSSNHIILELITDVLQARMQIWRPKGATEEILEAAWQTHRRLVAQNGLSMPLAGLIQDLGQDIPEGKLQIEDLATDIAAFQNPEEVSDLFPAFPDQYTNNTRIDSPSLAGSVEPRVRARQLLHLHAHDPEFPRNTITDILSQLSEHGGSALSDTIELFLVIHQSLPSGLDGSLMAALQSSGSQGLVTMLQLPAGSLGLIRFLQAVVLRGGLDLSVLLQDAIEPALHICLSQLDTRLPEMIQLAERMLILLEPFWSWEEIDDADSLRLEARFIGSLVSDSIDFVLSCLSHLLAIADALDYGHESLARRCRTLCVALVGHVEFKVAILRDLDRVTTTLLTSVRQSNTAGMQTLSFVISAIKSANSDNALTREWSGTGARSIGNTQTMASALYASQLARVELQLYLKQLELQPQDSLSTQGTEFARQFLEKLLDESATAGSSVAVGQLSAFGPSGVQQLLQAFLDNTTRILRNITPPQEQTTFAFSRLHRLSIIARHLIQHMQSRVPVSPLVIDPSFASSWTLAARTAAAGEVCPSQHIETLCDICCLNMRFGDVWSDHQNFLQESLEILLKLAKQEHDRTHCGTRNPLEILDVVSYLLDYANPLTRYQALVPFQEVRLATDHSRCQFRATFEWLIALGPSPATIIESTTSAEHRLVLYKPWDYAEHTEPPATTAREAASTNSGSVDLHRLSARVLSVLSKQEEHENIEYDRGRQSNFDSEISTLQESVWRTDFRRSLTAQLELPPPANAAPTPAPAADPVSPSVYTPSAAAVPAARVSEQAKPAKSVTASKAGTEPTTATMKKQATKKRKIAPEVIVVEDESPKRKKTASKKKK